MSTLGIPMSTLVASMTDAQWACVAFCGPLIALTILYASLELHRLYKLNKGSL